MNHRLFILFVGLVVLFACGTQIFWTIREIVDKTFEDHLSVYLFYVGAIIGAILGSILVPILLKRTLYVSIENCFVTSFIIDEHI